MMSFMLQSKHGVTRGPFAPPALWNVPPAYVAYGGRLFAVQSHDENIAHYREVAVYEVTDAMLEDK